MKSKLPPQNKSSSMQVPLQVCTPDASFEPNPTHVTLAKLIANNANYQINQKHKVQDSASDNSVVPVDSLNYSPIRYPTVNSSLSSENLSGSSNWLSQVRNGYGRLSQIAQRMNNTQIELNRGMIASKSALARAYYGGTSRLLGIIGVEYNVPDLRQTVNLQLAHVREYGQCLNEIISQTQAELNSTHEYGFALGTDVLYLDKTINEGSNAKFPSNSAQSMQDLINSIDDPKKLGSFMQSYTSRMESILANGNQKVAAHAIVKKKEYFRHTHAITLLLTNSLTNAKKMAVDTLCYGSMINRLSSSYFALGCNASQMSQILGGLASMQNFTTSLQTSVASALKCLDGAITTKQPSVANVLENTIYKLKND